MRWVLLLILVPHGLLHLLGVAKAFGLAELTQLTQPISRTVGVLWLIAALLTLSAVACWFLSPRWFWLVGGSALLLSETVILTSWADAKFGSVPNAVLLLFVLVGFAAHGPFSMRAEYGALIEGQLARPPVLHVLSEADLRALPEPVQRYLRVSGSVGQPQIHSFRARWKGRIRSGKADPWMPFEAEQYNFYGQVPARLFFMDAVMKGLPVAVFHRFVGEAATFRARVLSAFTVTEAKGAEMNRAETVTLFNDLCVLAPSRLVDPSIQWQAIDAQHARARYTRGAYTITAELTFNAAGELVDFASDDRSRASADGKAFQPQRWTTPLSHYQSFGSRRLSSRGDARWEDPAGPYAYGEFELLDIQYNLASSQSSP